MYYILYERSLGFFFIKYECVNTCWVSYPEPDLEKMAPGLIQILAVTPYPQKNIKKSSKIFLYGIFNFYYNRQNFLIFFGQKSLILKCPSIFSKRGKNYYSLLELPLVNTLIFTIIATTNI